MYQLVEKYLLHILRYPIAVIGIPSSGGFKQKKKKRLIMMAPFRGTNQRCRDVKLGGSRSLRSETKTAAEEAVLRSAVCTLP